MQASQDMSSSNSPEVILWVAWYNFFDRLIQRLRAKNEETATQKAERITTHLNRLILNYTEKSLLASEFLDEKLPYVCEGFGGMRTHQMFSLRQRICESRGRGGKSQSEEMLEEFERGHSGQFLISSGLTLEQCRWLRWCEFMSAQIQRLVSTEKGGLLKKAITTSVEYFKGRSVTLAQLMDYKVELGDQTIFEVISIRQSVGKSTSQKEYEAEFPMSDVQVSIDTGM